MDFGEQPPTDSELVRRARRGDEGAFHQLVDRHAQSLFGLAAALVGDAADAQDVVQETLAGAYRGLPSFRGQASVKTWLTRILVRQAAGHYRRERRNAAIGLDDQSLSMPAGQSAQERADFRMDLGDAIMALSPEHREVIVLRELRGLSYEEIADILATPRGTVESRLFRARRQLQELLKEYL